MAVTDYELNETLQGTGIEFHECPECGVALEHNDIFDRNPDPVRAPTTITEAAYEDATLDALLTPIDEDDSVLAETRDDSQSTFGIAVCTSIDQ